MVSLLATGKKVKGIKRVTIDKWIGSKIADKGLKRLEKSGQIKQEKLKEYIKISFLQPDKTPLFCVKSANPLIDLYQYSGDRSVKICEICRQNYSKEIGKHVVINAVSYCIKEIAKNRCNLRTSTSTSL